jgi:hypothetical protein
MRRGQLSSMDSGVRLLVLVLRSSVCRSYFLGFSTSFSGSARILVAMLHGGVEAVGGRGRGGLG